mmetsp:Transcript_4649/g.7439  ORF Transcript_4649/g.7439 Transcript_4649/m.7439 type:complete len:217 (-) Transcript_4649:202-852(-)
MQEPADVAIWLSLPEDLGHQHQVVVVHPDVIIVLIDLQNCLRESLVCLFVGLPLTGATFVHTLVKRRHDVVKQWPKHVVREAVVVLVDEILTKKNWVAALLHGLFCYLFLVLSLKLCTGPAKPDHVKLLLDACQAGHKASGTSLEVPVAISIFNWLRWQPVCDHDDLLALVLVLQLFLDALLEVLLLLLLPDVLLHQFTVSLELASSREQLGAERH